MTRKTLSKEEIAIWLKIKQKLLLTDNEVPVTRKRAEILESALPPKNTNESIGDRIRNMNRLNMPVRDIKSARKPSSSTSFRYLTQIVRMAADTDDDQFPLPDPGWVYESDDGRWRLKIESTQQHIRLFFQSLGFAVDELARRHVIFLDDISNAPFATAKLDKDGDGYCELPNTKSIRRALCQPYVLIEDK